MTDTDRNFEHLPVGKLSAARFELVANAVNRAEKAASRLIERQEKPSDIIPAPLIEHIDPELLLDPKPVSDPYAGIAELGEFGAKQLAVLEARAAVDQAYREAA